jgi:hypothetical protein
MQSVVIVTVVAIILVAMATTAESRLDRKRFERSSMSRVMAGEEGDFLDSSLTGVVPAATVTALRDTFRVGSIKVSTLASQAAELAYFSGGQITRPEAESALQARGWTAWAPSAKSPFWARLVSAFQHWKTTFGAAPVIREIVLYKQGYDIGKTDGNVWVEPQQLVASYSGGSLAIYSMCELVKPARGVDRVDWNVALFPVGRSGPFPQKREAVIQYHTYSDAAIFILTHELAHAFMEKPSADTTSLGWETFLKFRTAVGWTDNGNTLYDCGAISKKEGCGDTSVDSRDTSPMREIYKPKWNSGENIEQPYSRYAVSNAMEDFAESATAFMLKPRILTARAPIRDAILAAAAKQSRLDNGLKK